MGAEAMTTKSKGFLDYVRAAFNARPAGMFIPPNWLGVGLAALLGLFVNPGYLVLGLGLEFGYLFLLATNGRFQRFVDGKHLLELQKEERARALARIRRLGPDSQKRLARLQQKCEAVLESQTSGSRTDQALVEQHAESLNRFAWIFFQLLLTREGILSLEQEGKFAPESRRRLLLEVQSLEDQLGDPGLSPDLSRSLSGKLEIVRQRLQNFAEGEQKLQYVESELSRIEQQVELLRERALIQRDSSTLGAQIDSVGSSLGDTADWIRTQRSLFDTTEDLAEDPPPLLARLGRTETQA